MVDVPFERFEELVADALDGLPEDLGRRMDNVVVSVRDRPSIPGLLGLYEGVPLTARAEYGGLVLPDRITIFREPVAHHFGIDDDRLDELGWA